MRGHVRDLGRGLVWSLNSESRSLNVCQRLRLSVH
jgi:hypothetical protein